MNRLPPEPVKALGQAHDVVDMLFGGDWCSCGDAPHQRNVSRFQNGLAGVLRGEGMMVAMSRRESPARFAPEGSSENGSCRISTALPLLALRRI